MTRAFVAGWLLCLASCAPRKAASPSVEDSAANLPARSAITLERTACFGRCPVYTLAVSPSGELAYEGKAHVRRLGKAVGKIPQERVDTLAAELEKAGYFSFADRYTSGEPACGRYATDSPSVITSVTIGGKTKRIEHDYGCSGGPGALVVLERRIDEVLGSSQWTGR